MTFDHCEHKDATTWETDRKGSLFVHCHRCGFKKHFPSNRDRWPRWLKDLVGVK